MRSRAFHAKRIKYVEKYGVTKAAIKYKTNRQYNYRWKRRYDGTLESLRNKSRRPHHHPNQHTPEEIRLISDMRRRNPDAGLVIFWVKLKQREYSRSIPGLYRFLKNLGLWQLNRQIPNMSRSLMSRWTIPASASRLMLNSFLPPV